ncbi:MAG: methyltransferase domain-containing protein [Robiginitomaculum sp.]|nr:methyltransferase domain-containing protein [Robiginitomaculum sp.]
MSFIEPGLFDMIMRLRGRGISDSNVLRAMELVKRSAFVPDELVPESYEEKQLPIPCGQTLMAPLDIAIMCQSLDVKPPHKVLVIGSGSGYTAAVLAKMSKRVYAVERYRTLVEYAESKLQKQAAKVVIHHGDGRLGWRGQAPFDRILLGASVRVIPDALHSQLTSDGIIVAVVEGYLVCAAIYGKKLVETQVLPMELPAMEAGKAKSM